MLSHALRPLPSFLLLVVCAVAALAQQPAPPQAEATPAGAATVGRGEFEELRRGLDEQRRLLREQQQEIERLRAALLQQAQVLGELRAQRPPAPLVAAAYTTPAGDAPTVNAEGTLNAAAIGNDAETISATEAGVPQLADQKLTQLEERLARVEAQNKQTDESLTRRLGTFNFKGDLRLRYEGIFGQLNALPNSANPAILGNELTPRNRARYRARLEMSGQFGREIAKGEREIEWGLRLATGNYPDLISTNETMTDFFSRKPFGLDQAYVTYKPKGVPGLRLQGGKFKTPWLSTEMTIDVDLMPEGLNEQYKRSFGEKSRLKSLTFLAWQLPLLERNSAFVLGADGRVSVEQSRRAGRDLALYGAQVSGELRLTPKAALTLSAADLYFSGTQFIAPLQVFGAQLQIPVTITIPATATTPAQTVTTTVTIPRDAFVTGAGIGASNANTNAVNRDGRLSSGYNLVDLIAQLDLTSNKRYPVLLLLDYVHNTQAHAVVTAGPDGANRLLPNDEADGVWAELRVCRLHGEGKCDLEQLTRNRQLQRGDMLFGYTFLRIEKDAVLTPFNASDILQGSDVRVHRLSFNYALAPRVVLTFTDLISQRPHGLLGAFGQTPPGSLNRATHRLQFDTVFRF
ncbi:MAG TPA: putative porin [Pyrinomonadaceae bacterium]|jgi:hypothetical protein